MPIYFSLNTEDMKIYPIFLTTTGTYYRETERDRPDGFTEYQFLLTIEGEGVFEFDEQTFLITPGTLIFIPPNIRHNYYKKGERWITHWLAFDGNNIQELFNTVLPKSIEMIKTDIQDPIYSQMKQVNELTYNNYQGNALKISAIIYSMIADFVGRISLRDQKSPKNHVSQVDLVIKYMEKNYFNDITLDELADVVNISPQYLCRIFRKELGLRPFEYLKMLRINLSKTLLLDDKGMKIEDVAKSIGFHNSSYYGAIFRKYEKMTPREFIRLHKK